MVEGDQALVGPTTAVSPADATFARERETFALLLCGRTDFAAALRAQRLITTGDAAVVRVIAWCGDEPLGEQRRKPDHFAQLAPSPLSRQTMLC